MENIEESYAKRTNNKKPSSTDDPVWVLAVGIIAVIISFTYLPTVYNRA